MFSEIRQYLDPVFHELARQKECRMVERYFLLDHVHRCIESPPKYAVSSIIDFLKGKSATAIARQIKSKQRISMVRISGHAAKPFQPLALN